MVAALLREVECPAFEYSAPVNLTEIPANATSVTIQFNISSIPANQMSHLTKCSELNFIKTYSFVIERGAFFGMTSLRNVSFVRNFAESYIGASAALVASSVSRLSLTNNQISELGQHTFLHGPSTLEHLDLSWNEISVIHENTFVGLTKLQFLNLDHNQISLIDHSAFGELKSLQYLNLRENQISELGLHTFRHGPPTLEHLYLEDNEISHIHSGAFSGLKKLQFLHLSGNQISTLHPGAFSGLTNLQDLNLRDNRISELSFKTFLHVKFLDLSRNKRSVRQHSAFVGLKTLTTLYLDNNDISELDISVFFSLRSLRALSLVGNPGNNQFLLFFSSTVSYSGKIGWMSTKQASLFIKPNSWTWFLMLSFFCRDSDIQLEFAQMVVFTDLWEECAGQVENEREWTNVLSTW